MGWQVGRKKVSSQEEEKGRPSSPCFLSKIGPIIASAE